MNSRSLLKISLFCFLAVFLLYPDVSFGKLKVGVIYSGYIPYYRKMHYAFARGLIQNLPGNPKVQFIRQRPAPDPIALSNAARKLVVNDVDLIVAYGFPATEAALNQRSRIPVIYAGVYKPDTMITENKKYATGCGFDVSLPTILDFLAQINPIKKLQVIYTHNETDSILQMKEIAKLAEQKKIDVVELNISSDKDIEKVYTIKDGDTLLITGSSFVHIWIESIMSIVQTKKVATLDILPGSEEQGVLMCYYQDPERMGLKAAELAAKILTGAKPEQVEPVLFTESNLIVNTREARRLKCVIPDKLVSEATLIIE